MSTLIRDLPQELRPREKMLQQGACALTNAELLAIFLRTGIRGRSAIKVAQDLLEHAGGLHRLGTSRPEDIAGVPGVGPAKACQIAAAFELGARAVREGSTSTPLHNPKAIYDLVAPQLSFQPKEVVLVLTLDTRMRLIAQHQLSQGSIDCAICNERDVLARVLRDNAAKFILVHNHPSGKPDPSAEDHLATLKIVRAAKFMDIEFCDHVITGRPLDGCAPYYSFRESGALAKHQDTAAKEEYHTRKLAAEKHF